MAETKKKTTSSKKAPSKKTITKKVAPKKTTTKKVTKPTTKKITIEQTANNYGKTILSAVLVIILIVAAYIGCQLKDGKLDGKKDEPYVATESEKRFKKEYESINGEVRQSTNKVNKEINIIEDNNIEYITLEEASKILDEGSGVIYFGYAASPECRLAVPVLLSAMSSTALDKIYYVNLREDDDASKDIRDTYSLNEKNKAKKTKDADATYYSVLAALSSKLNDYVLISENGTKVNTGEKRLEDPTVVIVKDGELVDIQIGTGTNSEELSKEEETNLFNTYTFIISEYTGESCDVEKAC